MTNKSEVDIFEASFLFASAGHPVNFREAYRWETLMEHLDCVVIGAGVVGLAVARAMALARREVFILERTEGIGPEASSRNSEVIHAGLYYPSGSLKARLCVRGRDLLYDYCQLRGVRYDRIGKLVVASDQSEVPRLEEIRRQGEVNGVDDLHWLEKEDANRMEPLLRCEAALHSPSSGIVDSHGLMEALLSDAEEHGAILALNSPVEGGRVSDSGIVLEIGGSDPMIAGCRTVINCAGIHAQETAGSLEGFPSRTLPPLFMCKGNYFSFSGKAPFSHLIYPLPDESGLGIHLTFDLAGQVRFGPDAQWVDEIDYHVDEGRAESFYTAVRRYWPDIPGGTLHPGYSGIRAMVRGPGEDVADFVIQDSGDHGVPGLINLFGIESPGLTASMAVADEVAERVEAFYQ